MSTTVKSTATPTVIFSTVSWVSSCGRRETCQHFATWTDKQQRSDLHTEITTSALQRVVNAVYAAAKDLERTPQNVKRIGEPTITDDGLYNLWWYIASVKENDAGGFTVTFDPFEAPHVFQIEKTTPTPTLVERFKEYLVPERGQWT